MKKLITITMAAVLACASHCTPAMAEENVALIAEDTQAVAIPEATVENKGISVLLDGNYIEFDQQPTMINDRTMVPVRAIFEALGAKVEWVEETQTVVSEMGETKVSLKIDQRYLDKNGEIILLDVPATLVGQRTLVPVRAISEAYGCNVSWNEFTNTVIIVSDLNSVVMSTVNDENVSVGYFNFVLNQVESYIMQAFNTNATELKANWNSALGNTSFGSYIIESTLEQCIYTKSNAQAAKAKGIELTQADKDNIKANCDYLAEYYGEYYNTVIASMATTPADIEAFYTDSVYADKYYEYLVDEGSMSEKEIKKYLDDNYIRAKHILFSTVDMSSGAPLSQEEKAAKKALADETLAKINKGEDFDKLMLELSEDPGSKANPDGYLFTKGEMVESFETTSFALKTGKVSQVVESEYGYHIIKRIENGEYSESDVNMVKEYLVSDNVSAAMNSNKSNAKITIDSNQILNVVPVGLD